MSSLRNVASAFREGGVLEGQRRLTEYLEFHSDDPDALALGAYELKVRQDDDRELQRLGEAYFARLQAAAPNSDVYHYIVGLTEWRRDLVVSACSFERAENAPRQSDSLIGLELGCLAQVASGEARFQILSTEPDEDVEFLSTPKAVGLTALLRRDHKKAQAEFHRGAQEAANTVSRFVRWPMSPSESAQLRLFTWRDCLVGHGMAMVDAGRVEEGFDFVEQSRGPYEQALAQIPE